MTFNPTQKELFNKNLNALSNLILKEGLKKIKDTKFELVLGKDNLDINLKDTSDNTFLYENAINELNTMLNTYNDKYLLYPVLYFYGFGNGILFKALLQNKNHQHIVVFEKDLEIIWTMFHILDFSSELKDKKIIIFNINNIDIQTYATFANTNPFFNFSRIYFLELSSDYYEKFHEDILELNKNLSNYFKNAIISHGNDPLDALQGIEQFVHNLPKMITHPRYIDLLKKRQNLSDTAIIVSTGPSLTKQLPLLKQYVNKATIFCADSSYPILAKHNIKPDYVCMLERTALTSEFFNNNFGEFDKDILFICTSLVHPNTIEYLEKNNRNYILVSKNSSFLYYSMLSQFSYLGGGPTVAYMNYEIAMNLKHKNIILIGQDLAYADNGDSHPKDYQNSATFESEMYKDKFNILAYGGKGFVTTHTVWLYFKQYIETLIAKNVFSTSYNCTEGGARIEGAIEKPFKEVCEILLEKNIQKPFPNIKPLNHCKQNELMLKAYYRIYKSIKHCQEFKKEIEATYLNIEKE
ncbi:motility associated factor glycosyltransferase family protein, partial [Campylobacter jejuni]|nr:motility associated factor glycosyltransferase family protein [Campylobacter jejuni]